MTADQKISVTIRLCIIGLMLHHFGDAAIAEQASPPNVVLIYTDDQGVGDVSGLNSQAKFETPHLDRLIREGMTFSDGHSSDSVCTPSRYGLLTGRYCWRTWLKQGVLGADEDRPLIESDQLTVASMLREAGYRTGMFGKWHLGMQFVGHPGNRDWTQPFRGGPIDHGFETFFGIAASMNYGVLTYLEGDRVTRPPDLWTAKKPGLVVHDQRSYRIMPPYDATPRPSQLGQPLEIASDFEDVDVLERFTQRAVQFMQDHANEAFFVYLPLTSPHKPVAPADRFLGSSRCGAYGDFMIETDHRVGQILAALDQLKLTDRTIVIFSSDNGAENTHAGRLRHYGHQSCGMLRGCKRDLYEGGHRVPMFVRWPAEIAAGAKCDQPVCHTDVLATLADILDIELPTGAAPDSFSMLPAWRGDAMTREPLIHHSAKGRFAIRDGRWKLIDDDSGWQLFDLQRDLGETTNVASMHPDQVTKLSALMKDLIEQPR